MMLSRQLDRRPLLVYDNSDLAKLFHCGALFEGERIDHIVRPLPEWFVPITRRV